MKLKLTQELKVEAIEVVKVDHTRIKIETEKLFST